jgi:hypothetical protein
MKLMQKGKEEFLSKHGFKLTITAFVARAISKAPELELYQTDKRHPSVAGTYLAACTTFAALYGKSPVGVRFDAGLGAERAAMLQQTAWETVQDYFKR